MISFLATLTMAISEAVTAVGVVILCAIAAFYVFKKGGKLMDYGEALK